MTIHFYVAYKQLAGLIIDTDLISNSRTGTFQPIVYLSRNHRSQEADQSGCSSQESLCGLPGPLVNFLAYQRADVLALCEGNRIPVAVLDRNCGPGCGFEVNRRTREFIYGKLKKYCGSRHDSYQAHGGPTGRSGSGMHTGRFGGFAARFCRPIGCWQGHWKTGENGTISARAGSSDGDGCETADWPGYKGAITRNIR